MPSDHTGHRDRHNSRRVAALAAIAVLLIPVLVACSTGSANEAEQAQEDESTNEVVVPERQATFTAQFVEQSTPTPIPDPPIRLGSLILTTQVGSDGSPNGEYESFPSDGGTMYVAAQLGGVREGVVVRALIRDTTQQKNVLVSGDVTVSGNGDLQWVAVPLSLNGNLPPGDYPVWIVVAPDTDDVEWVGSVVFSITSPGSSAQQVGNGGRNQDFESDDSGSSSDDDFNDETGDDSPPIQPVDGEADE